MWLKVQINKLNVKILINGPTGTNGTGKWVKLIQVGNGESLTSEEFKHVGQSIISANFAHPGNVGFDEVPADTLKRIVGSVHGVTQADF